MTPESINSVKDVKSIEFESDRLVSAYNFAQKSHEGQFRKSGEPYFTHCVEVFNILKNEWGVKDEDCLIAALLHDTVEDTDITPEQLKSEFGNEIAELVSGVTKLKSSTDRETLKKVLNKSYIDPRVSILKLADRLHNMRTLEFMKPEKQIDKSRETLDVYTRLAESLGIWSAKTELEDLCFKYLDPKKYQKILSELKTDKRLSPDFTCYLTSRLEQLLFDNNNGQIETRKNGCWILTEKQEKMALKGKSSVDSFKDINDVISFRVKLSSINDIYRVLHEIHSDFGEMVDYDRFDEFIGANKRVNGYQALQTTINFPQGPVEIALMTKEMEEFNNWGVISLINEKKDLKDYVLKLIFTPTGSVRFLPKNATGVDFAAAINPRVLAEAESINIDGIDKPLTVVIPNASTIRVNIGESRRAPIEGLEDYALPQTRKVIQEQRIKEKKDILIKKGQEVLESILIPRGLLVLTDVGDSINSILYKFGCQGINDFYFMLGNGSVKENLINKELNLAGITKEKLRITSIRLKGQDKAKVLVDVIKKISDMDKNIIHIDQKNKNGDFNIRILVKDMSKEDETLLQQYLSEDKRFSEGLVI
ncbi:MAG: HD domain-containing protein [Candidatus Shapirobacteria bacterium]|jgi:(p)ppGpp synthase/HD superfamily hydrolase/predicted amino acid-binding ACT domain protein